MIRLIKCLGLLVIVGIFIVVFKFGTSEKVNQYFDGTVTEVGDSYIIVQPFEDEKVSCFGKEIYVSLEKLSESGRQVEFAQGDLVRVMCKGISKEEGIARIENVFQINHLIESGGKRYIR